MLPPCGDPGGHRFTKVSSDECLLSGTGVQGKEWQHVIEIHSYKSNTLTCLVRSNIRYSKTFKNMLLNMLESVGLCRIIYTVQQRWRIQVQRVQIQTGILFQPTQYITILWTWRILFPPWPYIASAPAVYTLWTGRPPSQGCDGLPQE